MIKNQPPTSQSSTPGRTFPSFSSCFRFPRAPQAKATAIGAHFETVPPGQNLPELRLSDGQQYFYAEVPGLGGKGTARLETASCHSSV